MKKPTEKKITQSKLADILGISRQLVAFHVKTGKAPKLDDTEGWIEYLAVNGREGSLPKEVRKAIAEQRLRLIRAQADRMELENQSKNKELIAFNLVARFITEITSTGFFAELERMAQEFPVSLKGKTEVQIRAEVKKQIEEVKRNLSTRLDNWVGANGKRTT